MKKFLYLLNKTKVMIIAFFIVFFFLGYFVTDFGYNDNFSNYAYQIETNEDMNEIINVSYFKETFIKIDDYNKNPENKRISYAKSIDYEQMVNDLSIKKEGNTTFIYVPKKYFNNIVRTSNGLVNEGPNRCKNYFNTVLSFNNEDYTYVDINVVGYVNPFMVGSIVSATCLIIMLVILGVLAYRNKEIEIKEIADNETLFVSPFHLMYWKHATTFLKSAKNIATISALFALMMLCKLFVLPSGFGALGLSLTYIFFAVISSIYGPLAGLLIGFLSDNLGYLLFQSSQIYFPGYTLTAMLSGFIYGICFYRTKITFVRCLYARLLVNVFMNILLGSFWWKVLYNLDINGFISYMTLISIPKNMIYLLPQTIVLYLVFKAIKEPLKRFGLYDARVADNISLF